MTTWKRTAPNEWPWAYISGPMTNLPDLNRAEFAKAESLLRSLGVENIFNPATQDRPEWWTWERHMLADLHELTSGRYGLVVLLPGWDCSTGAAIERRVAKACGIPLWEVKWL